VISDLLGHSSVITTAIYAKVVNRRKFVPAEVFARQAA
jgi:site-specific recombinase XerD